MRHVVLDTTRRCSMPSFHSTPLLRLMGQANSMKEIALSLLVLTRDGYEKFGITPKDIVKLAKSL